jgi:hypothetical protein
MFCCACWHTKVVRAGRRLGDGNAAGKDAAGEAQSGRPTSRHHFLPNSEACVSPHWDAGVCAPRCERAFSIDEKYHRRSRKCQRARHEKASVVPAVRQHSGCCRSRRKDVGDILGSTLVLCCKRQFAKAPLRFQQTAVEALSQPIVSMFVDGTNRRRRSPFLRAFLKAHRTSLAGRHRSNAAAQTRSALDVTHHAAYEPPPACLVCSPLRLITIGDEGKWSPQ